MAWIGRLLYNLRGNDSGLWHNDPEILKTPSTIEVTSDDFTHSGLLPLSTGSDYFINGDNTSPHLKWTNVPEGTQELVLVIQDPDTPTFFTAMHTVVVGISPNISSFKAGELTIPKGSQPPNPHQDGWRFGRAMMGFRGFVGPGPPRGHGPHRYYFYFYALKERLPEGAENWKEGQLLAAVRPLVLARGEIMGTFERS